MATCALCGQWMGNTNLPTPPVAGLVCTRCRWFEWRRHTEIVICAVMILAALICLWGAWQRTEPYQWIEPERPPASGQPDGPAPEEWPRVPASQSALVMSLDY